MTEFEFDLSWTTGVWLLLLLFVIVSLWMSIFQKAGYSHWLGLLIIVPVVDVIVFLLLAFGDWPVRRQLRYLKVRAGDASDEDAYNVLGDAFRLERKGQFDAAMERYQEIATRFSDRPPGRDAENYIQTLRTKM